MKINFKKITAAILATLMLTFAFLPAISITVNASYNYRDIQEFEEENRFGFDLSEFDLTESFSITEYILDHNGNEVEITLSFEPNPIPQFSRVTGGWIQSGVFHASGRWTSLLLSTVSMDFDVDLTQVNNQWRISNARNQVIAGTLWSFSNTSTSIGRATSTANFAAEATGRSSGTFRLGIDLMSQDFVLVLRVYNNGWATVDAR